MFKTAFGIECPGCGMQRALLYLLKGEIWNALSTWPPLLPFLLFLFLAAGRLSGVKKISGNMLKSAGFVCLIMILISYLSKLIIK